MDLFGFTTVIAAVEPIAGQLVAAGCRDDLTVWGAGAVEAPGGWHATRLDPVSYGNYGCVCGTDISHTVIPGTAALVVNCMSGGTSRTGEAVVLGTSPKTGPGSVLDVSCGVTRASVDGTALRITSNDPKMGAIWPSAPHPDFELRWSFELFEEAAPEQQALFEWFCPPFDTFRSTPSAADLKPMWTPRTTPVGPVFILGPVVFAADDACDAVSEAWQDYWMRPPNGPNGTLPERGQPIADLIRLPPPPNETDWFYACFESVP